MPQGRQTFSLLDAILSLLWFPFALTWARLPVARPQRSWRPQLFGLRRRALPGFQLGP